LRGAANSGRRQGMIENAHLGEQRGLIPIEMLMGHFAVLKLDEDHESELDPSTRGRHARKHPIHIERMRKADHELLGDPIGCRRSATKK
jgi:hypothetical protein